MTDKIKQFSNCSMYLPLSDDKHRKVRDNLKKKCTGNPRQIQSESQTETKCSLRFFSLMVGKKFFFGLNLSQTEFCLGLHTAVVFRVQSFN